MARKSGHKWQFFRAGGVDQVSLRDKHDLLALQDLKQELWVALAMPTQGVDIDPDTLKLLDHDNDQRIRVRDLLEAVEWGSGTFRDLDQLLTSADSVRLSDIADPKVVAAARRMLSDLGKREADSIAVADADAITKAFADTVLNGDGVVIEQSTDDPDLRKVIADVISATGSVIDRSGKPGVDTAHAGQFFADIDKRAGWLAREKDARLAALGEATAAAAEAFEAVRAKIEDYFVRCRVSQYDPRGATALAGQESGLLDLAARSLTFGDEQLARLPLSRIDAAARLTFGAGVNPAWAARIAAFVDATVKPIIGPRDVLTAADLATIADKLASYMVWRADRPTTTVDGLDRAWVERLAGPELRDQLTKLIASEQALAGEYDQISAVAKTVRMRRDFGRIVRNFVNFSDFYSKQDGVFQAGTLYLDARALHLCIPVSDAAKHGTLAAAADACLVYCDISRQGVTKQIAAAITNGDADNVFVGRNGIFYDRDGNDWDATVIKIISNPISVREAFWTPYKKLVKAIEDNVLKRAQAAEAEAHAKVETAGGDVAHLDKRALAAAAVTAAPPPAAAAKKPEPKKIDLGTVAAIGVAIGGIGTLFGALLGTIFGLGPWFPIGIVGILLMISGPSMLLAWLKLRRRNLGPILDANGWAINGRARINVAFGAAMTELATLPRGAKRSIHDPYADKKSPWRLYLFVSSVLVLAGFWYFGKLDGYLEAISSSITSRSVLGEHAPVVKKEKAAAEAPAKQ